MSTTIFRIKIKQIKIQTDMEGHLHLDNLQELAFRLGRRVAAGGRAHRPWRVDGLDAQQPRCAVDDDPGLAAPHRAR